MERWLQISGLINAEEVAKFGVVVVVSECSSLEVGLYYYRLYCPGQSQYEKDDIMRMVVDRVVKNVMKLCVINSDEWYLKEETR